MSSPSRPTIDSRFPGTGFTQRCCIVWSHSTAWPFFRSPHCALAIPALDVLCLILDLASRCALADPSQRIGELDFGYARLASAEDEAGLGFRGGPVMPREQYEAALRAIVWPEYFQTGYSNMTALIFKRSSLAGISGLQSGRKRSLPGVVSVDAVGAHTGASTPKMRKSPYDRKASAAYVIEELGQAAHIPGAVFTVPGINRSSCSWQTSNKPGQSGRSSKTSASRPIPGARS